MFALDSGKTGGKRPYAAVPLLGLLAFCFLVSAAYLSQNWWRESGLRALQARNEPRVEIIARALRSEINRQDHLPIVLSLDSDVRGVLQDPQNAAQRELLSKKLQRITKEADAGAIYVVARDGTVVATGQPTGEDTLIGRSFADRSYVLKALQAGRSSYLGLDPASNRVRYFVAEAIGAPRPIGVAVIAIEFDTLESTWVRAAEDIIVTDADGIVFLASNPAFKYRKIAGATATRPETEAAPAS